MPFRVGSTGSMFPAPNRAVLVREGAAGAKAEADATVKAMMAAEIFMIDIYYLFIEM